MVILPCMIISAPAQITISGAPREMNSVNIWCVDESFTLSIVRSYISVVR